MRGLVPGLISPHPIGLTLPAVFHEDDFSQRFTAALDEVLAPVITTIDNLDAYLSPALAPVDFLHWLAEWIGVAIDETWPEERQRALVAEGAELFRWRGTVRGLAAVVAIYAGVVPEIEESGGAVFSPVPGGDLPGSAEPHLTVRVRVSRPADVDRVRLDRIVSDAKPAHIPHTVEVLAG